MFIFCALNLYKLRYWLLQMRCYKILVFALTMKNVTCINLTVLHCIIRLTILFQTSVGVKENIDFYTNITNAFMDWADASIRLPEKGSMWQMLVASSAMLRVSDAVGIQRALGATFNIDCDYDMMNMFWFINLDGHVEALLQTVFKYQPDIQIMYVSQYEESALGILLDQQKATLMSSQYIHYCERVNTCT